MQDIKAVTVHYPYYKNVSGGWEWPKQMRQVIRVCKCCLQYEGGIPKAPLCPVVANAPLDLLHVDFTSIENIVAESVT